ATWYSTGTPPGAPTGITFGNGVGYEINSRTLDKAGNYSQLYSTRAFTYDIGKPTGSFLTFAGSAFGAFQREANPLAGSAADGPAGSAAGMTLREDGGSELRILETATGNWWSNSGAAFSNPDGATAWFNANGGSAENWSYTHSGLDGKLNQGGTYLVQYRGRDKSVPANLGPSSGGLDSDFTVDVDSVAFVVDKSSPVSRVTFPASGQRIKTISSISGTSADTPSGVAGPAAIEAAIQETSPGTSWWNGVIPGTFTVTSEDFHALSTLGASWDGLNWSFGMPALQDGYTYRVSVRATDNALPGGNKETEISSVTFTYDVTAPVGRITWPISLNDTRGNVNAAALSAVSGTAHELFDIVSASVSFQEADTLLWYDKDAVPISTFNSTSQKWSSAAVTGPDIYDDYAWTIPVAGIFADGHTYNLRMTAMDAAGNIMTSTYSVVMRYDVTPPVSSVVSPANGAFLYTLPSVSGIASDPNADHSGVAGTQISISSGTSYWSGTGWVGYESWLDAVTGESWEKTGQLPPSDNTTGLMDGALYRVKARAYDVAANTQTSITTWNDFRFDVSSPTIVISTPVNGVRYASLPLIYGTARDAFNVKYPQVRIFYKGNNSYWMGGTGTCGSKTLPAWIRSFAQDGCAAYPDIWNVAAGSSSASAQFTWTYDSSGVLWPQSDNTLVLEAMAADEAGNYSVVSSTFSFDNEPPVSVTTYPFVNGVIYSSMTAISGTSSDISSPVSDVMIKMWYVSAGTTYYWTPDLYSNKHWVSSDLGWESITGAGGPKGTYNPWNYDRYSQPDFGNPGEMTYAWREGTHDGLNGKTFNIMTMAVDATGNQQVNLTTRTFTFDNAPPVSGPAQPVPDSAYNSLSLIHGTALDPVSGIAAVSLSILSQNEPGGAKYYSGAGYTLEDEFWIPAVYTSTWAYSDTLGLVDGRHYVVRSSATDNTGNVQSVSGYSRFLYDTTLPESAVSHPGNASVYQDDDAVLSLVRGNSLDAGYTSGINGTGSGVYPTLAWHKAGAEIMVFRDTEPYMPAAGPLGTGLGTGWDSSGFFWDGSTWTPVSGGATWIKISSPNVLGNWSYDGLVCDDVKRAANTCWMRGDAYLAWSRVTDNAGNLQTSITGGPKFYIAAPAASFKVESADVMGAGDVVSLTVTAMDGVDGAGSTARAYQGTVTFHMDLPTDGPETMDDDDFADDAHGLPQQYNFKESDYGTKIFSIMLRKNGLRTLSVKDPVYNGGIVGAKQVTVGAGAAAKLQIVADYPGGEAPAPGTSSGVSGAPRSRPAGTNVGFLVQVVDQYYNLVVSSAVTVAITDTDDNNTVASPDDPGLVFVGSTTFNRIFVSADSQGWRVSATGAPDSSKVPIVAGAAKGLLALLPGEVQEQGKYLTEPYGKSGPVSNLIVAGSTFSVVVYAVDQYYNTDTSTSIPVIADINTDSYDVPLATLTLTAGTTVFRINPITAGTQTVRIWLADPSYLGGTSSPYITPNPVKVWWGSPVKLHLLAEGQWSDPGKPPYDFNPGTGGRGGGLAALTAGVTTQMTVNVVDQYYNVVRGTTPFMLVTASNTPNVELMFGNDPNIKARGFVPASFTNSLIAGTTSFAFRPVTRNQSPGLSVSVKTYGSLSFSSDTVSGITVNPDSPSALQLLLPTQTPDEGSIPGKTGGEGPLVAGSTYTITVRSVDTFWNLSPNGRKVRLTSNDIYAEHPDAANLDQGEIAIEGFMPSATTANLR
ncbi:MAG: hypothetical protein COT18_00830, partial [Elusimicrobia bacterium CG08_land_8_20_14_0_20_59_10]